MPLLGIDVGGEELLELIDEQHEPRSPVAAPDRVGKGVLVIGRRCRPR